MKKHKCQPYLKYEPELTDTTPICPYCGAIIK